MKYRQIEWLCVTPADYLRMSYHESVAEWNKITAQADREQKLISLALRPDDLAEPGRDPLNMLNYTFGIIHAFAMSAQIVAIMADGSEYVMTRPIRLRRVASDRGAAPGVHRGRALEGLGHHGRQGVTARQPDVVPAASPRAGTGNGIREGAGLPA